MTALAFVDVEKALGTTSVSELCLKLGVQRPQVIRWRGRDLDEDEARRVAELAGLEAEEVWPALRAVEHDDAELEWEDPPPIRRRHKALPPATVTALMAHPGKWAKIRAYSTNGGSGAMAKIRAGKGLPAGAWEACCRTVDGRRWLYVRYVGEG